MLTKHTAKLKAKKQELKVKEAELKALQKAMFWFKTEDKNGKPKVQTKEGGDGWVRVHARGGVTYGEILSTFRDRNIHELR